MTRGPFRYPGVLRSALRAVHEIHRDVGTLRQMAGQLDARIDRLQRAVGRVEARQDALDASTELQAKEFQVYSQWGEDGIIDFLTRHLDIGSKQFIEIGVEDYRESNTRFLLQNQNWSGLVIDGSMANVEAIRRDDIYWRHNIKAECSFIDAENVNDIIRSSGLEGRIGLLSIDIDGNDYWVWKAVEAVQPDIVVCEYNGLFGPRRKVTVPYDRGFDRTRKHFSHLYFGSSIAALDDLGRHKSYCLVGSNTAGCNLFFVRRELVGSLSVVSPAQAYVRQQFRESRDELGQSEYVDFDARLRRIRGMPVYDLDVQALVDVADLYHWEGDSPTQPREVDLDLRDPAGRRQALSEPAGGQEETEN